MTGPILRFGNAAVPWTVSWSAEDTLFVGRCPQFKKRAICQSSAPGQGKPHFGKPHMDRQRAAIARCLCDLCGKPLKLSTKVSLSHARPISHSANGWEILQVEPLLHKACAAESMKFCPSLKRDIADGSLMIRQVTQWRAQAAVMSAEYTESVTGQRVTALGHAKSILHPDTRQFIKWWGECIGDRFNVPTGWGDVVKLYDIRMLATEKRDLMPQGENDHWSILDGYEPFKFEIIPWPSADHAVRRFLDLYGKIRP